jgi:hypothetical protein
MGVGQRLRLHVQPARFRTIFHAGLLALGAYLSLRAVL